MNKDDIERVRQELEAKGIRVKVIFVDTRPKRLVKFLTTPGRILVGAALAYLLTSLPGLTTGTT